MAVDANQIDIVAIDFACYIANMTRSKLTGVFFHQDSQRSSDATRVFELENGETVIKSLCEENIKVFEEACIRRGIRSQVIRSRAGRAAKRIIAESRFADCIIIKAETSFEKHFEGAPTFFAEEVLAASECPVLIAPLSFQGIDEIIFAYDGSSSAVFAMKQFSYQFPQLAEKKAILLEVNETAEKQVIERERIGTWLQMHYSGIGFHVLQGKADDELFRYLLHKKSSFVVMGAFGRGMLSGLLKQSTAHLVLQTVNCPFFIAHH